MLEAKLNGKPVIVLDTARLNVVEKKRSNTFAWRGQFTPELVEYFLEKFSPENGIVIDPFCGSGTVLAEASKHFLDVGGFEINPAAFAMAKFYSFAKLSRDERLDLIESLEGSFKKSLSIVTKRKIAYSFPESQKENSSLLDLAREFLDQCESKSERLLALLILFEIESSNQNSIVEMANKALKHISTRLLDLPYSQKTIATHLCDARQVHNHYQKKCGLVITSPPYVNVFNYHQNHRSILELFGFNMLRVATSEIGSNRKNRSNRFKTVIQYAIDMEQVFLSLASAMKANSLALFVVGRVSTVRAVPIYNSKLISLIATSNRSFSLETQFERAFINRFGTIIREDVLVLRRSTILSKESFATDIACNQLKESMTLAPVTVLEDIRTAVNEANSISASPLMSETTLI